MPPSYQRRQAIISITPDLSLDVGNTYAGGLGVLEGDKLYAASKLGLNYLVFCLLYKSGYVDYQFDDQDNPVPQPQPQPREFLDKLRVSDEMRVKLRGELVHVKALEYSEGTAKAVFFSVEEPEWAMRLTERLYIENSLEERFYKYTLLAKASETYIPVSYTHLTLPTNREV